MKHTILFLGTPDFALPVLKKLNDDHRVIAVITQPDKPVGRQQTLTPPPAKRLALELNLTVFQPASAGDIPGLISGDFDFLVTAAYGEYLPEKVLSLAKIDSLNVHPSLLPKYRGATPLQSALLNGDKETGVSIIRMVKKMDAGPVFLQEKLVIPDSIRYPLLSEECSKTGARLISQTINNYSSLTPREQDETQASNCQKITKEDGRINWNLETALRIHNKLRAYTPWPGVYAFWGDQKITFPFFIPHYLTEFPQKPGTVFRHEGIAYIQCLRGAIELTDIQLAGKKETKIKDFLNGHPEFIGSKLS